jgi:hypothetical protein
LDAQVVRLLAVCADQKNFVAESACQKILSFHACLSIVNMPNIPNTTKVVQTLGILRGFYIL